MTKDRKEDQISIKAKAAKRINWSFFFVTAASLVLFYMATVYIKYAAWTVRISDAVLESGLQSADLPEGYSEIALFLGQGSAMLLVTFFRILFGMHIIGALMSFGIVLCAKLAVSDKKLLFRFLICFSCFPPLLFFIGYLIVVLTVGIYFTGIIVALLLLISIVCAIVFAFLGTAAPKTSKRSLSHDEMPSSM